MARQHSPGFLAVVNDANTRVKQIDIDQYRRMREAREPHILIDVREESEWNAGHAAGAVHLGKGIIERDIETRIPDHNACLVLYCSGGYRSALSGDNLQKMGYRNVISLDGGWRALQASGLPLEIPSPEQKQSKPAVKHVPQEGALHRSRALHKDALAEEPQQNRAGQADGHPPVVQ